MVGRQKQGKPAKGERKKKKKLGKETTTTTRERA